MHYLVWQHVGVKSITLNVLVVLLHTLQALTVLEGTAEAAKAAWNRSGPGWLAVVINT
jgi:hypothetical protein